ncbi:MAG: hypothetical protein IKA64_05520 [Clostridia bacterium]|nr:hypothetical protein [Clostridia bacterium]
MKRKMKLGAVILALSLALSSLLAVAIPSAAVTEETPAPADSTERLEPTGALEGYYYALYSTEDDYLFDIADGALDGVGHGDYGEEETLIDKTVGKASPLIALPAARSFYILVLSKDVEITNKEVALASNRVCVLDLNGYNLHITTTTSAFTTVSVGDTRTQLTSADFTVKNGTIYNESTRAGQIFSVRMGSFLTFEDVVIDGRDGGAASFVQDFGGDITFRRCDYYAPSNASLIDVNSTPLAEYDNCVCNACQSRPNISTLLPFKNTYTFDGFNYYGDDNPQGITYVRPQSHANDDGLGKPLVDVIIKGNSSFVGQVFGIHKHGEGTRLNVQIEEGTRFDRKLTLPKLNTDKITVYVATYVDKAGNEIDEPVFGSSGLPEYPYQLGTGLCKVSWYGFDGKLVDVTELVKGAYPVYTGYVAPATQKPSMNEEGEPVIKEHDYWSLTEGGEPLPGTPLDSDTAAFYSVPRDVHPSVAIFDAEGKPTDASVTPVLSAELLGAMTDGALARIYTDAYIADAQSLVVNASVTLDLNGYTLSLITKDGETAAFHTPAAGLTLTVEDGTIYSEGAVAIAGAGDGTVRLNNVELKCFNSSAIDLSVGRVELYGGMLNVDTLKKGVSGILLGKAGGSCSLAICGTVIDVMGVGKESYAIEINSLPEEGESSVISIELGAADGVSPRLLGGSLIYVAPASESTLRASLTVDSADLASFGTLTTFADGVSPSELPVTLVGTARISRQPDGHTVLAEDGSFIVSLESDENTLAITNANLTAYKSFSVWRDLIMNVYIPVDSDIDRVTVNGTVVFDSSLAAFYETAVHDGVRCYLVRYTELKINRALDGIKTVLAVDREDVAIAAHEEFDLLDYSASVISGDYVDEAKALIHAILSYVKAAYGYFNPRLTESDTAALLRLDELLDSEIFGKIDLATEKAGESDASLSELSDYISSVQLRVAGGVYLTLNLTEAGRSAPLTVSDEDGVIFETAGVGTDSVEIELGHLSIADVLTVSVGEQSGSFSLAAYRAALVGVWGDELQGLSDVLLALERLGVASETYEARMGGEMEDVGGDTPVIDAPLKR